MREPSQLLPSTGVFSGHGHSRGRHGLVPGFPGGMRMRTTKMPGGGLRRGGRHGQVESWGRASLHIPIHSAMDGARRQRALTLFPTCLALAFSLPLWAATGVRGPGGWHSRCARTISGGCTASSSAGMVVVAGGTMGARLSRTSGRWGMTSSSSAGSTWGSVLSREPQLCR